MTMTNTFGTALFVSTALALGASNLPANAQPYGPGPGGMMGGGWGWGMGWGMGEFGGICLLVVALLVVGFAFLAVRRRNS
jgi:Spy/CpxP family protein refolding chaperone